MTILERIGMWLARRRIEDITRKGHEARWELAEQYEAKLRTLDIQLNYLQRQDAEMRRELEGKRLDFVRMNSSLATKTRLNASLQTQLRDITARTRGAVALAIETLQGFKSGPIQLQRIDHAITVLQNVVPLASEPSSDVPADPPLPQLTLAEAQDHCRAIVESLATCKKKTCDFLTSSPADAELIARSLQAPAPQPSTQPPPTATTHPTGDCPDSGDTATRIARDRARMSSWDTRRSRYPQTYGDAAEEPDTATTHQAPQPPPPSTPS